MNEPVVYVIILNWNGWQDTIACLESLFASRQVTLRAVVCDNASGDNSMRHIIDWAWGKQSTEVPENPRLARLMRKVTTPIRYSRLTRTQAESNKCTAEEPLVLIDNGANLGLLPATMSGCGSRSHSRT